MTMSRLFLTAVLVLGLTVGAAGLLRVADPDAPRPEIAAPLPAEDAAPHDDALAVLHAWDRRRARAWARGDVRALGSLYTPGSVAGLRDRMMLRGWSDRGLGVRGMAMQVFDARVREHSADRIVIVVSDRLTGAVAVGPGVRRRLPADRASTRTVTLRRLSGAWRVASVRG